jgi:hypothetical protein
MLCELTVQQQQASVSRSPSKGVDSKAVSSTVAASPSSQRPIALLLLLLPAGQC